MTKTVFAENLSRKRKEMGLTQGQVAIKLGINRKTYENYEQGRSEPDIYIYCNLKQILGIKDQEVFVSNSSR